MSPPRSRRVQAQRKFAQGAYVPPTNVAIAAANDNRRDAAQDARNITLNAMSPTNLLDVVSFQEVSKSSMHTHLQPVVIVERLRGKNLSRDSSHSQLRQREKDNEATQKPIPPKPMKIKKQKEFKRMHVMSLRSRRLSKLQGKKIVTASSSTIRQVAAKRKVLIEPEKPPKPKKKLTGHKDRRMESSEFSLDDNRPLTYFAKYSSTPIRPIAAVVDTTPIPPIVRSIPVAPIVRPTPVAPIVRPTPVAPIVQPTPGAQYEQFTPVVTRVRSAPVVPIVPTRIHSPEPVPGPSGLQRNAGVSSRTSYYSDHDIIHTWMNNSLTGVPGYTLLDNGITFCPVQEWRSFRDVINASAEDLESRCTTCDSCLRVAKIMKLSTLLKTQVRQFDLTGTESLPSSSGTPLTGNDATASSEADHGNLYLDLMPKHPGIMMKLRIHVVHGKKLLSACLIPQSDARKNMQEVLLEENEHLLDQLIETLMLSLNDESTGRRDVTIYSDETDVHVINKEKKQEAAQSCSQNIMEKEAENLAIEAQKKAETARIEAARIEAARVDAARVDAARVDAARVDAARIEAEKKAELSRIEAEVRARLRAEVEAEVRMMVEVDEQAKALEKEKDAKSFGRRNSEIDINAPGGSNFPQSEGGKLIEAPVFRPTDEEFKNPITYFEKIWPEAYKFGICKVVPPPGWKPKCKVHDEMRFEVMNQYIARLCNRWGSAAREQCGIRLCLRQQKVNINRIPVLDGVEVNLPKLYHLVQRHGGLETVINRKRWSKVADDMQLTRSPMTDRKLDQIYVKYLLPYDTLSHQERQEIMRKVEKAWQRKYQKLLDRAMNPLHRQKKMLGLSDTSDDEAEDPDTEAALKEAEDCIIAGSAINRAKFKRLASITYENVFGPGSEAADPPPLEKIEEQYWQYILLGAEHLCVHAAAIDTGEEGYGFTKNKNDSYGKHGWNLKNLMNNPRNVLRHLGPVLGMTVPTLHLGMLFSTSCWHKDPHALSWTEFQHLGPTRIWYGIPSGQNDNFRRAVETISPTSCQNKKMWLPTDISMIAPTVLREHNVTLSRTTQEKGEFILAFPEAYTCCISTGYTESESVYFAPPSWLKSVPMIFMQTRESCEPTMFSMEQLLYHVGKGANREELEIIQPIYDKMLRDEVTNRQMLQERGLKFTHQTKGKGKATTSRGKRSTTSSWTSRDHEECDYCRATLFLSKVRGLTPKDTSLCLEHALKLLDAKKYKNVNLTTLEVFVYVSVKDLNTVGDNIKRRLAAGKD